VVGYDDIATLAADKPVAYVDMAGNGELRERLHRHFGDRLVYSGRVGLTHQTPQDEPQLPGAKPVWFFAPDQIRKRAKEWGPGGIDRRFTAAWATLVPELDKWIQVTERQGPDAVRNAYLATLSGKVSPDQGYMLSLAG
jgi:hypothetical protein